eukprot:194393-Pleurochrysis_carterae.AAC.1
MASGSISYKLGKPGSPPGAEQVFDYLCALREPAARGKGDLPCARLHPLFGSCDRRASGACESCRVMDATPQAQRRPVPTDVVDAVKRARTPALRATLA